ncbi:hypothetical protein H9P43_004848 [Blastocladiella emersonii ATCC 22665]|nr:hypothetical protein H9P43_004848 [Blastocladiella emersonii ATCC 22665]
MHGFRFRVTGKVQKVFFRKCTQERATELGLRGHVMNMPDGSVTGVAVAESAPPLDAFRTWLSTVGSPSSKIETATFGALSPQDLADAAAAGESGFTVVRKKKPASATPPSPSSPAARDPSHPPPPPALPATTSSSSFALPFELWLHVVSHLADSSDPAASTRALWSLFRASRTLRAAAGPALLEFVLAHDARLAGFLDAQLIERYRAAATPAVASLLAAPASASSATPPAILLRGLDAACIPAAWSAAMSAFLRGLPPTSSAIPRLIASIPSHIAATHLPLTGAPEKYTSTFGDWAEYPLTPLPDPLALEQLRDAFHRAGGRRGKAVSRAWVEHAARVRMGEAGLARAVVRVAAVLGWRWSTRNREWLDAALEVAARRREVVVEEEERRNQRRLREIHSLAAGEDEEEDEGDARRDRRGRASGKRRAQQQHQPPPSQPSRPVDPPHVRYPPLPPPLAAALDPVIALDACLALVPGYAADLDAALVATVAAAGLLLDSRGSARLHDIARALVVFAHHLPPETAAAVQFPAIAGHGASRVRKQWHQMADAVGEGAVFSKSVGTGAARTMVVSRVPFPEVEEEGEEGM